MPTLLRSSPTFPLLTELCGAPADDGFGIAVWESAIGDQAIWVESINSDVWIALVASGCIEVEIRFHPVDGKAEDVRAVTTASRDSSVSDARVLAQTVELARALSSTMASACALNAGAWADAHMFSSERTAVETMQCVQQLRQRHLSRDGHWLPHLRSA